MDWWMNLNEDLLEEIVLRSSYNQYLRLRLICKEWQSILPKRPRNLPTSLPCLMLPYDKNDDTHCDFFSMFIGEKGEIYNLKVPEALNTLYVGSSKGWLVRLEDGPSIRLINPLTSIQFELPPIYTFPNVLEYCPERIGEEYTIQMSYMGDSYLNFPISLAKMKHKLIHKVVLSSSPTTTGKNCFVMAIYGDCCKLACCRLGDDRWKTVEGDWNPFDDVIHYGGKFYAVDYQGMVIVVPDEEIDAKSAPKAEYLARLPSKYKFSLHKLYLVISCGELLIVDREIENQSKFYETVNFKIFKLNKNSESESRWSEIENLGEQVLFLGLNESFSISSHHLVQCSRKGNCIYFTDDNYESEDHSRQNVAGSDLGVFYLNREKRRFQTLPLPSRGYNGRRKRIWPPPIWVMPNAIVTTTP